MPLPENQNISWKNLYLLLILFIYSSTSFSAQTPQDNYLDVSTKGERSNVIPYISYFIDYSSQQKVDDILSLEREDWTENKDKNQHFGQINAPVWFKLKLNNLSAQKATLFIELNYPHHDLVDLYFFSNSTLVKTINTGDHLPFNSRNNNDQNFIFPIPSSYDTLEVYLSVRSEGLLKMPLHLVTQPQRNKQIKSFTFVSGIYYGAILIMLAFNFFIYLTVKDKAYLYYLAYIAFSALFQLTFTGLAFQYLWPEMPFLNHYAIILTAVLLAISAVTFVEKFVGITYSSAKLDYLWIKFLVYCFIIIGISSLTFSYHLSLKMLFLGATFMVLTGLYIGVKYWIKGVKSARFFALAWFSYIAFVIVYLMDSNQLISSNLLSDQSLALGSMIELCLLSIAFADKLNSEKQLRVKAQNALLDIQIKMNEDLDNLVKNRTADLESANIKLKVLSETDSLTQIKNRYYLDNTLDLEFKRAAREHTPLSIIMLDIDHFKKINDQFGHLFGDYCLTQSAAIIQSIIHRPSDTVARYGGEEIAILLPNTSLDGAMQLAERVREQFRETEFLESNSGFSHYLTVSLGVASTYPQAGNIENARKLLEIADQCLYKAKESGRDKVVGQNITFEK